jgi:hypothetical protein
LQIGGKTRSALVTLGAFGFFVLQALLATRPLARDLRSQTLAGPDPVIDLWTVNWLSRHLLQPTQLYGGNIFQPVEHAVLFSDLSLGTAVLLPPFRVVADDPVPLYNLAVLLALSFAGFSFFLLSWTLTGCPGAGLLAGTLAAFGSHQLYHVYHLNLLTTGWLALLLLGLHQLLERPGGAAAVLTGVSFALSVQSSGYYAVAAVLLPLVFAVTHARRLFARGPLRSAILAAILGSALALPYLLSFLEVREAHSLRRPPGMSRSMAFQPARDLGAHGYLYRAILGSDGERLFPGALSLALAGLAAARRRPHAGFYSASTLLLLLVSLGPAVELFGRELRLPYAWIFAIPPLDGMRHPYTFAAVATMTLAVLAALGWRSLAIAEKPWAAVLVLALALAETLAPPLDVRPVPADVPPAYRLLETLPPGLFLELPVSAPDALLWAARHGRPAVNGDGAFLPARHALLERYIQNNWIKKDPQDVDVERPTWIIAEEFPVRYVIVPCGRRPAFRAIADAFDRSQTYRFAAEAEDGDRVYEVRR